MYSKTKPKEFVILLQNKLRGKPACGLQERSSEFLRAVHDTQSYYQMPRIAIANMIVSEEPLIHKARP